MQQPLLKHLIYTQQLYRTCPTLHLTTLLNLRHTLLHFLDNTSMHPLVRKTFHLYQFQQTSPRL
jgi:hypothetical protein